MILGTSVQADDNILIICTNTYYLLSHIDFGIEPCAKKMFSPSKLPNIILYIHWICDIIALF